MKVNHKLITETLETVKTIKGFACIKISAKGILENLSGSKGWAKDKPPSLHVLKCSATSATSALALTLSYLSHFHTLFYFFFILLEYI